MSPRRSYAVSWREGDGPQYVGKLELRPTLLSLEGRGPGCSEVGRATTYGDVSGVASARPNGYRCTLLLLGDGTQIVVTSLDGPGALTELESELRARTEKPHPQSGAAPMIAGA
jgi:hypothetical protein